MLPQAGGTIVFDSASPSSVSSSGRVSFNAGSGGLSAPTTTFGGQNVSLQSTGDITLAASDFANGSIAAGQTISATGALQVPSLTTDLDLAAGRIHANSVQAGRDVTVANEIALRGGSLSAGGSIAAASISYLGTNASVSAGGNINVGGTIDLTVNSTLSAGGNIAANSITAGSVRAGGSVTLDGSDSFSYGILASNLQADSLVFINSLRIAPTYNGSGNDAFTPNDLNIVTGSIHSSGAMIPFLSADGLSANPFGGVSTPGSGGAVSVNVTQSGLAIAPGGGISFISANGGIFNDVGPFGRGNGGSLNINTAGDMSVDAPI